MNISTFSASSSEAARRQLQAQQPNTSAASGAGEVAHAAPPAGTPMADLVIDRFDPSNGFPVAGDRIDFSVTVRNRGTAAAGPFNVEVSGPGMRPDQERVRGLAPGESSRLRFGPANTGFGGSTFYDARVDVGNEVAEEREDNNWAATSISVRDPFPRDPFPRDPFPPRPPFPPR